MLPHRHGVDTAVPDKVTLRPIAGLGAAPSARLEGGTGWRADLPRTRCSSRLPSACASAWGALGHCDSPRRQGGFDRPQTSGPVACAAWPSRRTTLAGAGRGRAQPRRAPAEHAPHLLTEPGVGPICAAQLLVSSGDPRRMVSEASFAALAGTSSDRRLERAAAATPTQPERRPATQLGPTRHRPRPHPASPRNDRLLPTAPGQRQNSPGSTSLRQTRARPPLLRTPPRQTRARLDTIEA
jgi:Transposase IS116/IS110/IS902 family